jgi:Tol biopolymer transport system component
MRRLGAIAVAAVVVVTPAAAEPDGSLLAVSASGSELVLLSPAGEVAARIVEARQLSLVDATWSPDGTRIAFTSQPPGGTGGREVYVVDADGSDLHAVTADSNVDRYNTLPLWISPTEIVYHRRDDRAPRTELRVVDVDTRVVRTLAPEADANFPLRLQPHGSLLLYTLPANLRRALVDVRTGERRTLPEGIGAAAAWSHDGTLLAYGNGSGLHVVRPDGSEQRTLLANRIVAAVAWAPDDSRLVFTIVELFGTLGGKFGTPTRSEVYTVAADGTGLRRLTGMDGDSPGQPDTGAVSPEWWPDGSRILFRTRRATTGQAVENWVMNADGTCETPWAPLVPTWATPQWRPARAPSLGPIDCSSAIVRVREGTGEIGLRDRLPLTVTVRNDGTRPLRNLRVALSTTRGALHPPGSCDGLTCPLGTIEPGDLATLRLDATSPTPGLLGVAVTASYDGGPDVFPGDDRATVAAGVLPCDLVGTWGADRIEGTPRRDRICGRPGDDRIDAGAGNDYVDAGSGRDTVLAGRGRDTVRGGGGSDVIVARDGERDVVDCGTETDTVIADRKDVIRGCERVLRR